MGWDGMGWGDVELNGSVQHCFTRAQQGQAQCPGGHMFQHCRGSGIHLPHRPWCFPSRAGAFPWGWGQPWPLPHLLPVYFLTLKYHLEDKHSLVWGAGGISLAAEAGPSPQGAQHPDPTIPPSRRCLVGLGSGLQPRAQAMSPPRCMSHAGSHECLSHCLVLPSAQGSAGSAGRAVMPNHTTSWHPPEPAEGL